MNIGDLREQIKSDSTFTSEEAVHFAPQSRQGHTPPTVAELVEQLRDCRRFLPHRAYELRAPDVKGGPSRPIKKKDEKTGKWEYVGEDETPSYSAIYAGSDLEGIARAILELSGQCVGIYATVQSVGTASDVPAVNGAVAKRIVHNRTGSTMAYLPGPSHRMAPCGGGLTCNEDINHWESLAFDYDPVRAEGYGKDAATDEEREIVYAELQKGVAERRAAGWPEPTIQSSGNGFYVWYHLEPFRVVEGDNLIKRVMLAAGCDDDCATPSHLMRLPGGLNCKGPGTEERPHRRSEILEVGSPERVTHEMLVAYAAHVPSDVVPGVSMSGKRRGKKGNAALVCGGSTTLSPEIEAIAKRICEKAEPAVFGNRGRRKLLAAIGKIRSALDLSRDDTAAVVAKYYLPRCSGPAVSHEQFARDVDYIASTPSRFPPGYLLPGRKKDWYRPREFDQDISPGAQAVLSRLLGTLPKQPATQTPSNVEGVSIPRAPAREYCEGFEAGLPHAPGVCGCSKLLFPYVPKSKRNEGGTLSSTDKQVVEEPVPDGEYVSDSLLSRLIGQPDGNFCPYSTHQGLDGYSATASYEAVAQTRCSTWSKCVACREYDRHIRKRDNLPMIASIATHIFTGTAAEWKNLGAALRKLKIKYASFTVSNGETDTTIIALDPDSASIPSNLDAIRPATKMEAVMAFAGAVDAIPDRVPKNTRKFSPNHTWNLLLTHGSWVAIRPVVEQEKAEAALVKAMTPKQRAEHQAAKKKAAKQVILDKGGIVWTRKEEKPLRDVPETMQILANNDVRPSPHQLAGRNMMNFVVWEVPVEPERIEAIRKAVYDLNLSSPSTNEQEAMPPDTPVPVDDFSSF